jgi:hypothetical protein
MQMPQPDEMITARIAIAPNRGAMLRRNATLIEHTVDGDVLTVRGQLSDLTQWTLLALSDVTRIESPILAESVLSASKQICEEHLVVAKGGETHG